EDQRGPARRGRERPARDRGLSRHRCGRDAGCSSAGTPPDGGLAMLELKSVDAGYGSFQALFCVSLEVKAGEAVGVIGPNGAGKSTLMWAIWGLIRPDKGSVGMPGCDVLARPAHRVVSLGTVPVPYIRWLL